MKHLSFILSGVLMSCVLASSILAFESPKGTYVQGKAHHQWDYVPGKVIVKFKSVAQSAAVAQQLTRVQGRFSILSSKPLFQVTKTSKATRSRKVEQEVGLDRVFVLSVPESTDIPAMVGVLQSDPAVEYAEPDYLIPIEANPVEPNDPLYGNQEHLPQIHAPEAWDVAIGDTNVVIGIIDTGTDWDHPDLAANIWRNEDEVIDGVDNDGNGFVDDIRGWDFVDNGTDVAVGEDGDVPDNDPMDFDGHGTHTSGIAAAVTDNDIGVSSISWRARIMPLRIGWHTTAGQGLGRSSFMAQAYVYAADNGASVTNLSFGNSEAVLDGARYAFESGVVVVTSAGNGNNELGDPLSLSDFSISVAAVDDRDRKASYSTYGDWVKVAAPGGDQPAGRPGILSTVFNDSYARYSGTSMASPLTAGLAALVRSAHPEMSAAEVIFQVVETADNIDAGNGNYIGKLGAGRINAYRALTEEVHPLPRLTMVGVSVDDQLGGDDNGRLDAGEQALISIELKNVWGDATNLTAVLSTDDWAVDVSKSSANFGTIPGLTDLNNNRGDNASDTFVLSTSAEALPHRVHFNLELTADNGYHEVKPFSLALSPSVLLVDDDDGVNNVEGFYTSVLDSLGVSYDVHEHVTAGTPSFEQLRNYPSVIWLCEWAFPSLDEEDRLALSLYLGEGGNLFVSGQDIGWDLNDPASGFDNQFNLSNGQSKIFYEGFLHARYLADDSDFSNLTGVSGDPIGDGLAIDVFQPGRSSSEQFPSEIEPIAPAQSIFNYPNGNSGAVRFADGFRVVYFAFGGYEAIVQADQRNIVLPRVLNWLNGLSIEHTPLTDTEDSTSARLVTALVTSDVSPLAGVDLYWDTDGTLPFNRVPMTDQGSGSYSAEIPAQSGAVQYFVLAHTENGYYSPQAIHSYRSQLDKVPPELAHLTQLDKSLSNIGPFSISVDVSDNMGVDENSVWLIYRSASAGEDSVQMVKAGDSDRFEASFAGPFTFGDTVYYKARALDISLSHNRSDSEEKRLVIGEDDFENGLLNWKTDETGWGLTQIRRVSGLYSANNSPGSTYPPNLNTSLTLAFPLDLSSQAGLTLSFQDLHLFAVGQEDFGIVEVSTDGEQTWQPLSEELRGFQTQFVEKTYSLDPFTGEGFNDVRIRFRTQTDSVDAPLLPGWFVDDVKLAVVTSVRPDDEVASVPTQFALHQNYPNPFNPSTKISFDLPEVTKVKLTVYNIAGELVASLVDEQMPAGTHTVTWNPARELASGVYLTKFEAGEFTTVKKMMFLK